jgi:hypothetical protein
MSRTKKYNKKSRTKKNNKKSRTFRKKRLSGGVDVSFLKKLRDSSKTGKTRTIRDSTPDRERKRTINPNGFSRFNRFGRRLVTQNDNDMPERIIITPPKTIREKPKTPTWEDNGFITDNKFGPSEEGLYAGPSIKYGTMGPAIPHGKDGTILYPSGHVYTGDFVKGQREGTGKLTIKEGPTYEGEWKDDKFVEFTDWKNANKNNSKTVL